MVENQNGLSLTRDKNKKQPIFGLNSKKIDENFLDPYICCGYRRPNISGWNCLKSAFLVNSNETANIWTHLLPFIAYTYEFHKFFNSNEFHYSHPFNFPLIANAIGILGFLLTSSAAHTFNSMSLDMRNLCFYLDYAAISIYGVGAGMAFYFYASPSTELFHHPWSLVLYCILNISVSLMATIICCITRHKWQRLKYLLRTSTFVIPFVLGIFPYMTRFFISQEASYDVALIYFIRHFICYIFGAIFNVSKFPEKYFDRKFDLFGQSHHFMHVFVAVGAKLQFDCVVTDIRSRRSILENDPLNKWRQYGVHIILLAMFFNYGVACLIAQYFRSSKKKKN